MSSARRIAALGRTAWLGCRYANDRNRRISPIAVRFGEGPLTEPHSCRSDLGAGPTPSSRPAFVEVRTNPDNPAEGQLDRGEGNEAGQGCCVVVSKSLASCRFRSNQEKYARPASSVARHMIANVAADQLSVGPARILVIQAQLALLPMRKDAARRTLPDILKSPLARTCNEAHAAGALS